MVISAMNLWTTINTFKRMTETMYINLERLQKASNTIKEFEII